MNSSNRLKLLILSIFTRIFQLQPRAAVLPSASPAATPVDGEETPKNQPRPAASVADQHNLDWAMIMIGFCLPSAVEMAVQSLQTQSQFPPMFHFLCLAIIFSFTFLFVGKFMSWNFPIIAKVLEGLGVFFAVTAIFAGLTIPHPLWVKCITWALYAISFIVVMMSIICSHI